MELKNSTIEEAMTGEFSVLARVNNIPTALESNLPEEVARQMVEDYAAEGETVWMERTAPESE